MLSRPIKLDVLFIIDLPDRSVFDQGLLQVSTLATHMAYFEKRAEEGISIAEAIMCDKL